MFRCLPTREHASFVKMSGVTCFISRDHTEEEVGRQHQGMDRSGLRQVPESSGEQGKIEETGCEVICGAPKDPRS